MNIRVDLTTPINDGTEVVFRSPVDCSQITGLIVYYNGESKEFAFADAHGNNVGDIDHLFAENVVVKVILDVTTSMAFVQNADTNAYLEGRFDDIVDKIDRTNAAKDKLLYMKEVDPTQVIPKKYYFWSTNNLVNMTGTNPGKVKLIQIEKGATYYVTSQISGGSKGFAIVSYFDSHPYYDSTGNLVEGSTCIGREFENDGSANVISISMQQLTIPENAEYFYVNSRGAESAIFKTEEPTMTFPEVVDKVEKHEKEISILFVGNSLTQDAIMYLPYVLRNYYPEVSFRFYLWYNGGQTLANHYSYFTQNKTCELFSVAENVYTWTHTSQKTMQDILSIYKIDIVCMQEYFNNKASYTEADMQAWNNCKDYIITNYKGGNGLKFVSLFHAPLRSKADIVYGLTKDGNALILKNTICEDVIPVGMAVYRALSTDLDSLGDSGHLSPDGIHTQEGLPCLMQTYTALLWLLDQLGISKSVYGLPLRMTTEIYNSIGVGGANLGTGVITGTDAENLLAQEIAIKAYKEGKSFVNKNMFEEV